MFQESAVINQGEISVEVRAKIGELRLHYFCTILYLQEGGARYEKSYAESDLKIPFPFP